jgi:hypothetical protein
MNLILPSRAAAIAIATAIAVSSAACGGGGGGGGGEGTTDTTSATGGGGGGDGRPVRVGRVGDVLSSLASLDGRRAAGGDSIFAGALLTTDTTGVVTFGLDRKLSDCQLQPGSEVRVVPSPDRLLDFQRGTTVCSTAPGSNENVTLGAGSAQIEARDPIFAVDVQGGRLVVRTLFGFVRVRPSRGEARLVGPRGQLVVSEGRAPPRARLYDPGALEPRERQAFSRMEEAQPDPDFRFPRPAGSATLSRIDKVRALRAGVVDTADSDTREFAGQFSAFLAEKWRVRLEPTDLPQERTGDALASGQVDLVVSPRPVPGARGIPFFDNDRRQRWSLFLDSQDRRFESALRDFLVNVLNIGQYGNDYQEIFGQMPDYVAVERLLFP